MVLKRGLVFILVALFSSQGHAHSKRLCSTDLETNAISVAKQKVEDLLRKNNRVLRAPVADLQIYISGSLLRKARALVNEHKVSNGLSEQKVRTLLDSIVRHPRNKNIFDFSAFRANDAFSDFVKYLVEPDDLNFALRLRLFVNRQIWMGYYGRQNTSGYMAAQTAFENYIALSKEREVLFGEDQEDYGSKTVRELGFYRHRIRVLIDAIERHYLHNVTLPGEVNSLIDEMIFSNAGIYEFRDRIADVESNLNASSNVDEAWDLKSLAAEGGMITSLAQFESEEKRPSLRNIVARDNRKRLMPEGHYERISYLEEQLKKVNQILFRAGSGN